MWHIPDGRSGSVILACPAGGGDCVEQDEPRRNPRMTAKSPERLFLVDAMGFIFRAFHAPMERLRSPQGMPTKVPYIFAGMLRKLAKDWQPDYLAVVFDVAAPT